MRTHRLLINLVLGAALLGSNSCNCKGSESDETSALSGKPVHETETFKLVIEPTAAYQPGKEGAVVVRLTPKGAYKVNKEYPFRFECQNPPSEGVSYPQPTVAQSEGKIEEREAVFMVPLVPNKSGKLQVGGVFSLSVCNDDRCVLDKRNLVTEVSVP